VETAIEVEQLGKRYRIGGGGAYVTLRETLASAFHRRREHPEVWALRDVEFAVARGEAVGVIGLNGAGKSTLLKVLSRITQPTTGVARMRGRVGALLEVGTGFHPELTGRENIVLNGTVLGLRRREIARRFDDIVEFAGVERFLDTPLKRYSSGMYLRLAFAVAAHVQPDVLVVDEVLAVGDVQFRERCLGAMSELGHEGRTVIFVSHDLGSVARLCPRTLWLHGGRLAADGPSDEVIDRYLRSAVQRQGRAEFEAEAHAPVQLLSVAALDGHGAVVAAPRRDEELTIAVRFRVVERVPGLNIALVVLNRQGIRVLDEDWGEDTGRAIAPARVPEVWEAEMTVPPVLPAGEYVVHVWIAGRVGGAYDVLVDREALVFQLNPRPDDPAEAVERRRLVQPGVRWDVAPAPDETA
jgi:ABC-type polysaccharide/polyol phosphate transport system ATPase subunit